ncbi:MAG: beta-propeller domain-containing protein [Proteobacteria bacterium]|nr:beta-propeller domain-containing protein [Pseudomonadota bacterium]
MKSNSMFPKFCKVRGGTVAERRPAGKVLASMMVLMHFLFGCSLSDKGKEASTTFSLTKDLNGIRNFNDCREVSNYLGFVEQERERIASRHRSGKVANSTAKESADASSASSTEAVQQQEAGVKEPDTILNHEGYLFVKRMDSVVVVDLKGLEEVASLKFDSKFDLQLIGASKQLLVVGVAKQWESKSFVKQFSLESNGVPKLMAEKLFDVRLEQVRLLGNTLILTGASNLTRQSIGENNISDSGVPCSRLVVPNVLSSIDRAQMISGVGQNLTMKVTSNNFLPTNMTSVLTLDVTGTLADLGSVGVLDQIQEVYVHEQGLVAASRQYDWDGFFSRQTVATFLRKFDFDPISRTMNLSAHGIVEGNIKDRWALKMYKDQPYINVAATLSDSNGMRNRFYVLSEESGNLKQNAVIANIAPGEDIRAIRYVDRNAYIVTFKKTDPLYVIDLQNPVAPKIVGELKIDGFSSMLYPISGSRLLGVGFDAQDQGDFSLAQGVQVSLFDVAEKSQPKVLEQKVIGARGSYSEAIFEGKSTYWNPKTKVFGVNYTQFGDDKAHTGWQSGSFKGSGSVFYSVGGDALNELTRIDHRDLFSQNCADFQSSFAIHWWQNHQDSLDIRRMFDIGDEVVTVSLHGIKTYSPDNFKMVRQLKFAENFDSCDRVYGSRYYLR